MLTVSTFYQNKLFSKHLVSSSKCQYSMLPTVCMTFKKRLVSGTYCVRCFVLLIILISAQKSAFDEQVPVVGTRQSRLVCEVITNYY